MSTNKTLMIMAGGTGGHVYPAMAVADYLGARGYFPGRTFEANRFVLFSSRASTGGGPYVVEAAYPLG